MSNEPFTLTPSPADPQPVKVFRLDDYTWWAGYSLKQCIEQAFTEEWFCNSSQPINARECTTDEMERLIFVECCDEPDSEKRTFAAELGRRIASGEKFPQFFAATEG